MRLSVGRGGLTTAVLPVLLALIAGCAGSGKTVALDVVPKLPPAQSLASDPVKIVIEPFEDRRADTSKLGHRTHLGGGVTYFNVAGGKVGDTAAEVMAETLRQKGWQRRGWDARVVQSGVSVSGADIIVTGEVLELAANAKSRFFSTVITTECKMTIKASNLKDGSVTTRNVEGALTQTVFWFENDDVRKIVSLVLKDGFDRFVNDTKIEDGTIKSVR
ncbi:MAG TPA: hypothetical protein VHF07_07350 [Nitrospiraceae bacterium]|nr:hypothetical protein [Nitrospiraceae bacterium]